MKMKKLSALCLSGALLASGSAMAWESEDGSWSTSASVALSTDYVWRGYTQSNEEPAISGSFDVAHASGFYAGTWASNVDFSNIGLSNVSAEYDIYAGFGGEFGDSGVSYDIGVLRYMYDADDLDWNEFYASIGYSYFSLGVAHSTDVYNTDEDGTYWTLGFDYDITDSVALSAGIGYYDYDQAVVGAGNPDEAIDYRIGLSTEVVGFGVDLTYYDTDSDGETLYGEDEAEGRLVFTISKSM
jgi:uncharacterized protein (TIGR02001 family)